MVRTTDLIENYKHIEQESENTYIVRWGYTPMICKEYKVDEQGELVLDEQGNPIVISETESKVLATWCVDRYYYKPTLQTLVNDILASDCLLIPSEIKYMGDFLGEDSTEYVRKVLLEAITRYDLSDEVNALYLNGQKVWFDKVLRTSIERQIQARKDAGQATAPIAFDMTILQIPVDLGLQMLSQLEIYASDCYNVTLVHKGMATTLTLDEMVTYDFTVGYPEKLRFEL